MNIRRIFAALSSSVVPRAVFTVLLLCASPHVRAGEPNYQQQIRPLVENFCSDCHGPDEPSGGVNLAKFTDDLSLQKQRKLWRNVVTQLESLQMPPTDEAQPTAEERQQLIATIGAVANRIDCNSAAFRQPGKAVLRRLNRSEYNLTLRDLLYIDFEVSSAVGMPDDGVAQGYDNQAEALSLPPALVEKYFAAADLALDRVFPPAGADEITRAKAKEARDKLLALENSAKMQDDEKAEKIVARFLRRAYRRPFQWPEVRRMTSLYTTARGRGEDFDHAIRWVFKAVMVSPYFLLRVEPDRDAADSPNIYHLDNHEVATRLSYFLWSSMPDDELFKLAEQGKLLDKENFEPQVRRMLADLKARALTDHFAAQWLQLGKLATARPSAEYFPTFTPELRAAMHDETTTFFDQLRLEDGSLLKLLDADYTYLNEPLAKHYAIAGVDGPQIRWVALRPEDHRGGLLGMGSVLALTSHTSRTSPTLRGKWILEAVFGTPPPPPPPNAGLLDDNHEPGVEPKTFRQKMAQHSRNAACASCHKRIDPLGYGLEHFDAIGRWRDESGSQSIDNLGELPGGHKFQGAAGLKQILLERKGEFLQNLTEQMLTYALGRELEYFDDCVIRDVLANLDKNDQRFSALVLGIVNSFPFQHRQNTDAAASAAR